MGRLLAPSELTRSAAVTVAGGVCIALGALLPWYEAAGTGASAGAFAAGRGVLAAALLGIGAVVAAAAVTRIQQAWLAGVVGALLAGALGFVALGGAGKGLAHAGVEPGEMPIGQGPGMGLMLLLGGAMVALLGGLLLWRDGRR